MDDAAPLELLTIGRVSVDLYADTAGAGFGDDQRFVKSIGGTATNVAVAAARLGRRTALFTRVGADPFGEYVLRKLQSFGVDTTFVASDEPDMREVRKLAASVRAIIAPPVEEEAQARAGPGGSA